MTTPVVVADASVGVKIFCREPGTEHVLALVDEARNGAVVIAVDPLFVYETLRNVRRKRGAAVALQAWDDLRGLGFVVVPLNADLVRDAFAQADELRCDLYDAFSAGLAGALGVPLYSADVRAHSGFPGVVLVGVQEDA